MLPYVRCSANMEWQLIFASLSEKTAVKNKHNIKKKKKTQNQKTQLHDMQNWCSCNALQLDARPAEPWTGLALFLSCGHSPWWDFLAGWRAEEQSSWGGTRPHPWAPWSAGFLTLPTLPSGARDQEAELSELLQWSAGWPRFTEESSEVT